MNEDINPTLPLAYDLLWMGTVLAWFVLTVCAVVSVLRTDHARSGGKFWWSLLVVAVPVLGALVWFWGYSREVTR